jgi:hypothetical protein
MSHLDRAVDQNNGSVPLASTSNGGTNLPPVVTSAATAVMSPARTSPQTVSFITFLFIFVSSIFTLTPV